jgi:hypothetical protein
MRSLLFEFTFQLKKTAGRLTCPPFPSLFWIVGLLIFGFEMQGQAQVSDNCKDAVNRLEKTKVQFEKLLSEIASRSESDLRKEKKVVNDYVPSIEQLTQNSSFNNYDNISKFINSLDIIIKKLAEKDPSVHQNIKNIENNIKNIENREFWQIYQNARLSELDKQIEHCLNPPPPPDEPVAAKESQAELKKSKKNRPTVSENAQNPVAPQSATDAPSPLWVYIGIGIIALITFLLFGRKQSKEVNSQNDKPILGQYNRESSVIKSEKSIQIADEPQEQIISDRTKSTGLPPKKIDWESLETLVAVADPLSPSSPEPEPIVTRFYSKVPDDMGIFTQLETDFEAIPIKNKQYYLLVLDVKGSHGEVDFRKDVGQNESMMSTFDRYWENVAETDIPRPPSANYFHVLAPGRVEKRDENWVLVQKIKIQFLT